MNLLDVNWLAVLIGALAGFVVGSIWYGPVFGKKWMAASGLAEEDLKNANMGKIYGATFVLSLVISWTMAHTFASYLFGGAELGAAEKILTGFGVALGFVVPAIWINYLFGQKPRALFWIDGGYWLVFFTAVGAVHAVMP